MVGYVTADFKAIIDACGGVTGGCLVVQVGYAVDDANCAPVVLSIIVVDEGVHGVLGVLILDAAQV